MRINQDYSLEGACMPVTWAWKFFLPPGNSMVAALRWHPEKPGGEISERGAISPSLGQPKQKKKWISSQSEWARADNPHGKRAKQTFRALPSLPSSPPMSSVSTPNTHVFKELGQPKVGHAIKPKGKLSRPQLSCSQPEDKADYEGWLQNSETCPLILGIPVTLSHLFSEEHLKVPVKATKLCGALLCLSQLVCVIVNLGLRDNWAGWKRLYCAISSFYSGNFIHLTMTHSKKYIVHHNLAHPMHVWTHIHT